jgi:hypothetical protein
MKALKGYYVSKAYKGLWCKGANRMPTTGVDSFDRSGVEILIPGSYAQHNEYACKGMIKPHWLISDLVPIGRKDPRRWRVRLD